MEIKNYSQATDYLAGGRDKGSRPAPTGSNTRIERRDADTIAVRYHATDVVTWRRDGTVTLRNGGWYTPTTKGRMSEYTPLSVSQESGEWSVSAPNPKFDRSERWPSTANDGIAYWLAPVVFADGMTWSEARGFAGTLPGDELAQQRLDNKTARRAISKFVKGLTPERIVDAFDNSAGDCFICRTGATDCLASHVEEDYAHAALFRRAMESVHYGDVDVVTGMVYRYATRGEVSDLLTRPLAKYLRANMLQGVATR